MKRALSLLLCLLLALTFGTGAFADVIYTPEDRFYQQHADQCKVTESRYIAPEGSAAQRSPLQNALAFKLDENIEYDVTITYTDSNGIVWGCIEKDNKFGNESGWIPLDTMNRVYDRECFTLEHGEDFISAEGISPDLSGGAVFFEYPASPRKWVYGSETDFSDISYAKAWVDENGVTWLHVIYYYGMRGWICADNPLAGHKLAANTGSENIIVDSQAPEIDGLLPYDTIILSDSSIPTAHSPKQIHFSLWVALGASVLVAAVAVVLAVVLKKKK